MPERELPALPDHWVGHLGGQRGGRRRQRSRGRLWGRRAAAEDFEERWSHRAAGRGRRGRGGTVRRAGILDRRAYLRRKRREGDWGCVRWDQSRGDRIG